MAELFGNRRSQQLAAGQPSAVRALCWILASAERDRSLNLLGKGGRVFHLRAAFPRAREGGASASGFDPAARRRSSYGDCSARSRSKPLAEGWLWRVCAPGISGWVIGLLIGGCAGAERRAANPGRRCWPTARPAAVFCLGLGDRRWRSSSATAARNSWPQGSLRLYAHSVGCWHRPRATAP